MARARSITFNINTTADFAQLEGLQRAINDVSNAVEGLSRNMKNFNNNMRNIQSNYNKAAQSVDKVRAATLRFTTSLSAATKAETRYEALTRRRVALNRELQQQTSALTTARQRLTQAENNLARAQQGGDVQDIQRALNTYKEAKKEFESTATAARKTSEAVDKLTTEQRELATEIGKSKTAASGLYDNMSAEARSASGPLRGIIGTYASLENKIKGTIGTMTRMGEAARRNNRIISDVNVGRADPLVQNAERLIGVLKQADRAYDQFEADREQAHKQALAWIQKEESAKKRQYAMDHAEAIRINNQLDKRLEKERRIAAEQDAAHRRAVRDVGIENMQRQREQIDALTNRLRNLASASAGAFRSFSGSAAGAFTNFGRMLMNGQTAVTRFSQAVTRAMQMAQRAMTNFYNSGWSFITSGYIFQNFGQNLFRSLTGGLQDYMEYERTATRAAIAGNAESLAPIQDMVFGLQRGAYGGDPLMAMGATDIAQGLYYFISAIGLDLSKSEEATAQAAGVVRNILQLASATQTDVQTATKGVLNAVMEFGIDTRALERGGEEAEFTADMLEQTAAQFGYLANLTTMEVPDIAEAFKYVGPIAHALSGDEAGAGLNETMALIATASDVGLRGGNVGRGINQLFQSLLAPTKPAITAWAEAFGQEASKEAFDAFFFEADGKLKGGIPGLFEQLDDLSEHQIAAIFTNNAGRIVTGVREAAEASGMTVQEYIEKLSGPEAMEWLTTKATDITNQTVAANVQNLINSLFQFRAAIMEAIGMPLKQTLQTVAEAFYRLAEIVNNNPWIGRVVAGFIAMVAAVSTLIGTLFMAAGSIMLMLKAFAALGSMMGPMVLLFSALTTGLIIIVPVLAALAGAIIYVRNNFERLSFIMGIFFGFNPLVFFNNLRDGIENSVGTIPDTLGSALGTVNAIIQNTGEMIVQWAILNRVAILSVVESIKEFARGFAAAFVTVSAIVAQFSIMMGRISFDWGKNLLEQIREVTAAFTGLEKDAVSLSRILGSVLGGAFALLVARHFIPSIAMTIAFRAALLGLRAAMLLGAAASFIVAGAFKAIEIAVTIATALVSAFGTIFSFVRQLQAAANAQATVSQIILSAAEAAGVTVTNLLVASVLALVAAYFALVGVLALVLAATVVYITATQGLTAGLDAAWEAITGVAAGFWLVVEPIVKAAAAVVMLVGQLIGFLGIANDVHTLGMALGVMLGLLVVAVAGLTAAFAALGAIVMGVILVAFASLLTAIAVILAPIAGLVATVYLLGEAFEALTGIDPWGAIGDGLGYVADMAVWAYNKIKGLAGAVTDLFTQSREETIATQITLKNAELDTLRSSFDPLVQSQLEEARQQAGAGKEFTNEFLRTKYATDFAPYGISQEDFLTSDPAWVYNQLRDQALGQSPTYQATMREINALRAEQTAAAWPEDVTRPEMLDSAGRPTRGEGGGAQGAWEKLKAIMAKYGFDPSDPAGSITRLMGLGTLDEFTAGMSEFDLSAYGMTPEMAEYTRNVEKYASYQKSIQQQAEFLAKTAGEQWEYLSSADQTKYLDQAKQNVDAYFKRAQIPIPIVPVMPDGAVAGAVEDQISKEKFEIDLSAAIAKGTDLSTALKLSFGEGTAATGIMQFSDQIIKNLGDNAPWMNTTELLADAAISGDLGAGLAGKNIQKELEPFLRVTSEQTGVAISDMIKDIPRFVASEELTNIATVELIESLDTMPEAIAKRLDLLGTDVQDRWGNFVAENGFDWAELATYAASQGTEEDWNLIDYAVSAWDMTVAQAEQYFADHGIDPNIINGALFGDTRMMANMADGAVAVVDESFFKWATAIDENQDKILEITQAGFDALPLAVKIGLTNMGYSFVVGGEETAGAIDQTNQMIADRLENTYKVFDTAGKTVGQKASQSFWDNMWANLGDDGIINAGWSRVDDELTGMTTITDNLGNYIQIPTLEIIGAEDYAAQLSKLEADLDRWRSRRDRIKEELGQLKIDLAGAQEEARTGPWRGGWFAGGTSTEDKPIIEIETEIKVKQASLDRTRAAINKALGIGAENASVNMLEIEGVNISATGIDTFKTAITTATNQAIESAVQTVAIDGTAFVSQFTAIGTSAGAAFNLAFHNAAAVADLRRRGGSQSADGQIYSDAPPTTGTAGQTVEITYTADTSAFDTAVTNINVILNRLVTTTWVTTLDADDMPINTKITNVNMALNTYDMAVWTTYLSYTDVISAKLNTINANLDAYDTRVVNATVGITDFASVALQNIINRLNAIDGRVVSYSVQPTGTAPPGTGPLPYATGGVVESPIQLVGERGPELVALPQGSRVQSSARTLNMLRTAMQTDDNNVQLASIFRDISRETSGGDTYQDSGNTTITIQNVNINSQQNARAFFEELDTYQGRRNQLANRGMIPVTGESAL